MVQHKSFAPPHTRPRRMALLAAAAAVTVVGLGLHFLHLGDLAGLATDALYTVLVYLVLAGILPRAGRHRLALAAFAFSAAIELSQLTGIPATLAQAFPPSRLVLGTTFSAPDLLAYALGAAAAWGSDRALSRHGGTGGGRTWSRSQTE